jgi:hypothetical protein
MDNEQPSRRKRGGANGCCFEEVTFLKKLEIARNVHNMYILRYLVIVLVRIKTTPHVTN